MSVGVGPLGLALLAGCSSATKPPGFIGGADARVADAGPLDAGGDASESDSGPTSDGGGVPDGGAPEILAGCEFMISDTLGEGDYWGTIGGSDVGSKMSVGVGPDEFLVTWEQDDTGIPDVFAQTVDPSLAPGFPVNITRDGVRSQSPAALYIDGHWLLSWYDNSMGGYEVYAAPANTDLVPGTSSRLTTNSLRDDSPTLLRDGAGVLAAWVDDNSEGLRTAHTRKLDADGVPTAEAQVASQSGESPSGDIALVTLVDGYGLLWNSASVVRLQRLSSVGAATGSSEALTSENVNGGFDIAMTDTGGAIAYAATIGGSRREIRFRLLDDTGAVSASERIVTLAPEQGEHPSIAAFAGGYLVSYRTRGAAPMIRLALMSSTGDVLESVDVVEASSTGRQTVVRVSGDGQTILVTWVDDAEDSSVRGHWLRLRCEVP